jgi:Ca-activated chloride channel homolog
MSCPLSDERFDKEPGTGCDRRLLEEMGRERRRAARRFRYGSWSGALVRKIRLPMRRTSRHQESKFERVPWRVLPCLLGLILLTGPGLRAPARALAVSAPDTYTISVDVGLVVLPVVVTDRTGQTVAGLGQHNFRVFDNGRPQQISLFEAEDVPVTVGLVVDNSGSMWPKRPEVMAAAREFARSSNARDQMFVVNFNQNVSMGLPPGVPFTSNVGALLEALSRGPLSGNTALYDGIAAALRHVQRGAGDRRALIVISDGGDNASRTSLSSLLALAQASNVEIYAIGIYDASYKGEDLNVLSQLTKVTGGRAYFPRSSEEIAGVCEGIAQDLREQYTIGYRPSDLSAGGGYHAIRVTARTAGDGRLHVWTRAGYVMPVNFVPASTSDTAR